MLWERTLSLSVSGNRHARLQHLEPVEDEVELLALGRGFIGVRCRTFLEPQEAALETERGIVAETPRVLFEGDYFLDIGRQYDLAPDGVRRPTRGAT